VAPRNARRSAARDAAGSVALPARVFGIPQLSLIVPGLPPQPTGPRPRLWLVFQARFADPVTGFTRYTNPVAVRVDG
jgi:hypothetical protein